MRSSPPMSECSTFDNARYTDAWRPGTDPAEQGARPVRITAVARTIVATATVEPGDAVPEDSKGVGEDRRPERVHQPCLGVRAP